MADEKHGQSSEVLLLGAEENIREETPAIHQEDAHQQEEGQNMIELSRIKVSHSVPLLLNDLSKLI